MTTRSIIERIPQEGTRLHKDETVEERYKPITWLAKVCVKNHHRWYAREKDQDPRCPVCGEKPVDQ